MIEIEAFIMMFIIAAVIFTYVILDGFDLGVGINFIFMKDESVRDDMMTSIAPFWDGNETWMVLGAACLYGGFPKAFALVLPYFYVPITLMVIGLIFRGIAFEFRFKDPAHKALWSSCFMLASIIVAFIQGFILGHILLGTQSFGPDMELLPLITGFTVMVAYAALGSTWLMRKLQRDIGARCFRLSQIQLVILLLCLLMVTIIAPLTGAHLWELWFHAGRIYQWIPIPILAAFIFGLLFRRIAQGNSIQPFRLVILLLTTCFVGSVVSLYPYIVPYQLTFLEAAAPEESLRFMLFGLILLLPVLIGYTGYTYYIFRGRV